MPVCMVVYVMQVLANVAAHRTLQATGARQVCATLLIIYIRMGGCEYHLGYIEHQHMIILILQLTSPFHIYIHTHTHNVLDI